MEATGAVSFRASKTRSDQQPEEIHGNISGTVVVGLGCLLGMPKRKVGAFNLKVWDFYTKLIVLLLLFFKQSLPKFFFVLNIFFVYVPLT